MATKETKPTKAAKAAKTAEPKAPKAPKAAAPEAQAEAKAPKAAQSPAAPPRLKVRFQKEVVPVLMKEFSYSNVMQAPRLQKIVLNVGLGEAITNIKLLDSVQNELTAITGQRAVITKAKKAIATFKLRKGMPIGCKVTLRGDRMYEFLDRFISLALPRIRDFRGVPTKSFDGQGNYSLGLKEQIIFPEIQYDKVDMIHGIDVIICTSANTDNEARALLRELGMPFAGK